MAVTVTVFAGEGAGKTKIADVPVDPMSGTWQMEADVAAVPAKITVVSSEGGSYVAASMPPQTLRRYTYTNNYPSEKFQDEKRNQVEQTAFRPVTPNSEVKGEKKPMK
jgi:hypothetical protein